MSQYQQKVNNYIKQCIVEIYNHGMEYYNDNDDNDESQEDMKITAAKKTYINNIESSLKKLLNNNESILSHLKFELINNSSISGQKKFLNENSILDMINCMESDYESDDDDNDDNDDNDDDDDTNTLLNGSDEESGKQEDDVFNGTDSVKTNRYIGDTKEEEDGNIFYDNTADDTADDTVDYTDDECLAGCLVRQQRKNKKLADSTTPKEYFKDDEGYIYGKHCGKQVFGDNLCEGHYLKMKEKKNIELVTDFPLKYENTVGKNDTSYTDSEQSLTKSKVQELTPVSIKRKKYLVDKSNGHVFDARTHKFLGKRVKNGKKYDYIFNS